MINVEKVNPTGLFTNYIYKAIPLAFDESMSYYETLCGLLDYLKNTINPTINNNADALIELQNYVTHYFDNLNVQEEINNKLDEMVKDGTLQEIITQYLQINGILGFNKISDLISATNLINGSICKTLGDNSYNDGLGAFYKVRTLINTDTIDGYNLIALTNYPTLVAERIIKLNYKKLDRKIIGVGDSYGIQQFEDNPITKYYWKYLVDALGLTENVSFFKAYASGASFANGNFLQAVRNLENTITNKREITDILITGGWNDIYNNITEEMIINAMNTFNNYVKTNYPNANIKIGFIGYSNPYITNNSSNVVLVIKGLQAYKKGADILGWQFLNGCENILHYFDNSYWQTDGVHPSQLGQDELGHYIVQAFLNGTVDIFRKSVDTGHTITASGITSALPSGRDKILYTQNNNITKIETTQTYGMYFTLDNTTSLNLNGANSYEIANVSNPVFYGWNNRNSVVQPISIQVTKNGSLTTYNGLANFYINAGKLYFVPLCFNTSTNQPVTNVTGRYLYVSSLCLISDTKMC